MDTPFFRGDNLENNEKLPIYSYSKVKSFYNCPFYFFKNYLDRPEDFVPEGHGTSEFGSYVHKILEMYEKGELDNIKLEKEDILGDMVISIEKVKEQAKEYDHRITLIHSAFISYRYMFIL